MSASYSSHPVGRRRSRTNGAHAGLEWAQRVHPEWIRVRSGLSLVIKGNLFLIVGALLGFFVLMAIIGSMRGASGNAWPISGRATIIGIVVACTAMVLAGMYRCMAAPVETRLRKWAALAFGLNVASVAVSVLLLAGAPGDSQTVSIAQLGNCCWIAGDACLLMFLRGVGIHFGDRSLSGQAVGLLGLCGFLIVMALAEVTLNRKLVGGVDGLLTIAAFVWHLVLLYRGRGVILAGLLDRHRRFARAVLADEAEDDDE